LLFQNQLLLNENLEWELATVPLSRIEQQQRPPPQRPRQPVANRAALTFMRRSEMRKRQDQCARRLFNICSVFILLFAMLVPVVALLAFNRVFVFFPD
jgi:hypothetical protein